MDKNRQSDAARPKTSVMKSLLLRARWAVGGLTLGVLSGIWVGGGTDRYGQDEGVVCGLRGAYGTIAHGYRYAEASIKGCLTGDHTKVHNLGLERQIEIRLWQEKRLAAEAIDVEVEDGGKVVLMGQVPDASHKDKAVVLARDTRGVESVIDQLAVASGSRTIDAPSAPAVPAGVASGVRVIR